MQFSEPKLMLVMVGLPARGKSFVSRKVSRYLNWLGYRSKIFNIGNYRRALLGGSQPHEFFDPHNAEAYLSRQRMAEAAIDDLFSWLRGGGLVGILDGTNSTVSRRQWILQQVKEQEATLHMNVIFLELFCDDQSIIDDNIIRTKLDSPDYIGIDPEKAVADFRLRIAHYEALYATCTNDLSFIKVINAGVQIISNKIRGYLPTRIVFFLCNLHTTPKAIYLSRHGETEYNAQNRIGGESGLTENGQEYAEALGQFVETLGASGEDNLSPHELSVWTSTMKSTLATAKHIKCGSLTPWKVLDEINVGVCDSLTYTEVQTKYPEEFKARAENKLKYRYQRGESYEDVIQRLEPLIIELERRDRPVLIIAHRAVLRCLLAYFKELSLEEVPYIDVPLHTVIKVLPTAYGTRQEVYDLMSHKIPLISPHDQHIT